MKHRLILATCSLAVLTACSGSSVKETLGVSRAAPDEFKVVSRPPLSVPPQFSLRPPSISDESPTMVPADKQAQSLVLGKGSEKPSDTNTFSLKEGTAQTAVMPVTVESPKAEMLGKTSGESQFLKNVGAQNADPDVRTQLVEKQIIKEQEEPSWWQTFSTIPEKKEPLVDAKGEADRIKTNKDTGKPVTEGATPETKAKDRGILGRILGD